ncbi:interleukin-23 receptor [Stegastes partitus]|uniref:Interleukin-23 receptor n=1 Tax=Stegastes partitus TaxID=144197 RepID=A0A9Y4TMJ8_9TELE|nr:PREDICTED: interleukin-12 receptor subunit beta-2-like [Stegastes partitus]
MKLSSAFWRCIILLTFLIKCWPPLPASCHALNSPGYLTVKPDKLVLMGSKLTVYCHITEWPRRSHMSLAVDGQTVGSGKKINDTTTMFNLTGVWKPLSAVICTLNSDGLSEIIGGLSLRAGLPPDKPENIICETTRSSDLTHCSWTRGQETHLDTSYNISISRENGTQIHSAQTQNTEKITIRRGMLEENTKYLMTITAYNHFGDSQSDPFIFRKMDIVIPETPHITQIEFGNNSTAAMLQWTTSESSLQLRAATRLSADNVFWEVREGTELSDGLIRVDDLRPLTEYEFQVRTCYSASGLTDTSTSRSSNRSLCSKWSPSVRKTTPGKGPSKQLQVWRILGGQETNRQQTVTVLWKPPPPEDYSGEVKEYNIVLANDQKHTCAAAINCCSVQVPAGVQTLSISVVTSYGKSPPAHVALRHSGVFGPVLGRLAPAANGSALLVSWSWQSSKQGSASGGEVLYYMMQWTSVPEAQLQWRQLAKDLKNTTITGLTPGVRYNVSLYAVTTRGVSAPSSSLGYAREQKPDSGPNMSVLSHEARRILIQWDELPVDQQRGFITKYTVYIQTLDSSNSELNVIVPGTGSRKMLLDCPEGALALQLTASNSAGEGPRGKQISSQPAAPAVGLVIVIVFVLTIFIGIIANLMCWSCVRERIKQKCISWGPAWLVENLPKAEHSNAIRLLEYDRDEPLFSSTYSDPPLSPVIMISQEESDEVYPAVHVEVSQTGSGQTATDTPLVLSETGTVFVGNQLEHGSYKPQIAALTPQEEEAEENQRDVPPNEVDDTCSSVFEGLLGGLLSSVDVDFSDSPQGLTLGSVSGLLWPRTAETSVLNSGYLQDSRATEDGVETDSPFSLDVQKDDIMTPDTADLSLCAGETMLDGGYFPQVAAVK